MLCLSIFKRSGIKYAGLLLLLGAACLLALPSSLLRQLEPAAEAASFVVTSTEDSGPGSLRNAIKLVNDAGGTERHSITFNIPGPGIHTISPESPLPALAFAVTIDATTEPGFAGDPVIELDGSRAGPGANGLTLGGGDSLVQGLAINRFDGSGIRLQTKGGNRIRYDYIGVGPDGATAAGNSTGISIDASSPNNFIGSIPYGDSTIISGNRSDGIRIASNGNTVSGAHIGASKSHQNNPGNGGDGLVLLGAAGNRVGQTSTSPGSFFRANAGHAIRIQGAGATRNRIEGNVLGIGDPRFDKGDKSTGGNGSDAILITDSASANIIGVESEENTADFSQPNYISLNSGAGVRVESGQGNLIGRNNIRLNGGAGVLLKGDAANTLVSDNSIDSNNGLGIDLGGDGPTANDQGDADAGANGLQNFPVLSSVAFEGFNVKVEGTLNSRPNTTYRIELFQSDACDPSGYGEGQSLFGPSEGQGVFGGFSVTTDASGNASFNPSKITGNPNLKFITATATDPLGNTSEFSRCKDASAAGVFQFQSLDFSAAESAGAATVTVTRTNGSSGSVSVDYATSATGGGTATPGVDYQPASGTLTFAPGETSKSFSVQLIDDKLTEGAETLNLKLSNPAGGAALNNLMSSARLVILDDESPAPPVIFALNDSNELFSFNSETPGLIRSRVRITGLQLSSEKVVAIAFRPLNGRLYALTTDRLDGPPNNYLYTVDITTGVATQVGTAPLGQRLDQSTWGFHFNPVTDRIRGLTVAGLNLQLDPESGQVVSVDSPTQFAAGDINASQPPNTYGLANTNNFAGATSTTTYTVASLISGGKALVMLGSKDGSPISPSTGQLFTVGRIDDSNSVIEGLEIADNGTGFLVQQQTYDLPYLRKLFTAVSQPDAPIAVDGSIWSIAALPSTRMQFSAALYSANENSGSVVITVRRTGDTSGPGSVRYSTGDGTAKAGTDYAQTAGTLSFAAGETSRTFSIPLTDDAQVEGVETLNVTLSDPGADAVLGERNTATVAIMDEPGEGGTNSIENAAFFVRQHYLDFLGREPDAGGLRYWTNQITQCVNDALCIHQRRIGVSAAFFMENEFQINGSFVYRLYRGTLGRRPSYQEFNADRGRIVAGDGLEQSKDAFVAEWVTRTEFRTSYPDAMSNAEFVGKLFDTAGLTPYTTERAQLVAEMNGGKTRAQAVRQVVELKPFRDAAYNPSFVLMQYFGYLKRDPDDGGYQFWLNVLNNREPNNYRGMVCSFITSAEYQQRFGSVVTRTNRDCK